MIIDRLENLEKYAGAVKGLAPAARFLEGFVKTDMTPGRYELDGDRVVSAQFLREETEAKKSEVRALMQSLRKNKTK